MGVPYVTGGRVRPGGVTCANIYLVPASRIKHKMMRLDTNSKQAALMAHVRYLHCAMASVYEASAGFDCTISLRMKMSNGNSDKRVISNRSIHWLLEYFLASTTPSEGGLNLAHCSAASEISGIEPPDRDSFEALAVATRAAQAGRA